MADFQPFQGVVYNPERIQKLAEVIAPPYDVISPKEQDDYYRLHPHNIIRLILGKAYPEDNQENNVYNRSAAYLNQWLDEKILIRAERPGFYLTAVTFDMEGRSIIRYGITGVIGLEPFEKGIILPHECTFSKVKTEQLRLITACRANFNPIFGLYSDNKGLFQELRERVLDTPASWDVSDNNGLSHRMWPLYDRDTIQRVTRSITGRKVYIADGHHRYETALNHREWIKRHDPDFCASHPANFVLMELISMEDPGLIILPAHRLLKNISTDAAAGMAERAKDYFEIHAFPLDGSISEALQKAMDFQASRALEHAISVCMRSKPIIYVFVLRPGVMERLFKHEIATALIQLDVTVLTRLLLVEFLGFDQTMLDDEAQMGYCTSATEAVETVRSGQAEMCCILNPTTIEQVQRVSEAGLIMPRKSTYFYPKLISGQVMNLLR